tara:strand:- start:102 stop:1085 length:984 start_codon:yes stop_codon:yes gene_type:complete
MKAKKRLESFIDSESGKKALNNVGITREDALEQGNIKNLRENITAIKDANLAVPTQAEKLKQAAAETPVVETKSEIASIVLDRIKDSLEGEETERKTVEPTGRDDTGRGTFTLDGQNIRLKSVSGDTVSFESVKSPEALAKEKTAQVVATKTAEKDVSLKELRDTLDDVYFPVADLLPTKDGFARWLNAAQLKYKGLKQEDAVGFASAQLQNLNKRLRVTLVRAAGDVGNINIVEQLAAEQLLYNLDDSTGLRSLKKATLLDLSRAVNDRDESAVKNIIRTWMGTKEFQKFQPGLIAADSELTSRRLGEMSDEELRKIAGKMAGGGQ